MCDRCDTVSIMRTNYWKGELTKEVLMTFLEGGLALTCVVLPGMSSLLKIFKPQNSSERYRLRRSFEVLRQRGYLMRRIRSGKEEFLVTDKGKKKLAILLTEGLHIKRSKKWDKKWRVVLFDIPETKRHVRRGISKRLKAMGMHALQDSVFVSPFPCKEEIDFLTRHFFAEKYFVYLEADNIESKEDLMSVFKIRR
jgi:DNA-binding transcriptional regulator PaaX